MRPGRRIAAVLGIIVLTAFTLRDRLPFAESPRAGNLRQQMVEAIGEAVPFDARLSGGFAPPSLAVPRAAAASSMPLTPDARIALAEVEKQAMANLSAEARADLAVAWLIQGDVERAIHTLQMIAPQLKRASVWNDAAAAYLVGAERVSGRRLEYLARALEAAEMSNRLTENAEARFNEILVLEGLAPILGEHPDWARYLAAERDARWARVVRDRQTNRPGAAMEDAAKERAGRLRKAVAARDGELVRAIVRESPEAATDMWYQEHVIAWASALQADPQAASAYRRDAQFLAAAIADVTGDTLAPDEAARLASDAVSLARAHLAYQEATRAYARDDYGDARRLLASARRDFATSGSAYSNWADVQIATIDFQERLLDRAAVRLTAVSATAQTSGHWSLFGRARWMHGLVLTKQWHLPEAIAAFREAASRFEQTGQREHAAGVYHQLADTYRTLGESHLTWEYIARALESAPSIRSPLRRYLAYYNASLFAASRQLSAAALRFQSAAVREAARTGNDGVLTDALTQRAAIHALRTKFDLARADLTNAREHLANVRDQGRRDYLTAEIDVLESRLSPQTPELAPRLGAARDFFAKFEPARVPGIFLNLAQHHQAQGRPGEAVAALEQGIAHLEAQQDVLDDESLRISYFDDSWALFGELIALQIEQKAFARAFTVAESARGRLLRRATDVLRPSLSLSEIRAALPPDVTLVYFVALPNRLHMWALSAADERMATSEITFDELGTLVEQHRAALTDGHESTFGQRLHDVVVAPIEASLGERRTIVVVPDGPLHQLPLATLRNARTGRFLIEDHQILVAPSATFLAKVTRPSLRSTSPPTALLIGNPATTGSRLPGAAAEVAAVEGLYPGAEVWLGRTATKQRFLQHAANFEVVHFGGHGYANPEYPLLSRLAFASDDGDESLFAHEIAKMRFTRTSLIVLAACSTAGGAVSRGEGPVSVARPFLAAGVPQVIASQWDVEDRSTSQLFVEFHRALAKSHDAVEALRSAQLAMLRSGDPRLATATTWGAFVALGTLVQQDTPR
jgi:CHAT domain-containing protein